MSKRAKELESSQDELKAIDPRERIECLKRIVSESFVKAIVRRRKLDKRMSRKCPAYMMVWFTISLWLYGNDSYVQVFRWLHRFSTRLFPTSSALTQARAKIGVPIMAEVYRKIVCCICSPETRGAFYCGLRLIAVDGFVLNLPDSDANRKTFGRPKNGTSFGAFPQLRIVALCEVGSRVFFRFLCKPIRTGEATLAKHVYRHLPEKSLLLFDIGFSSYALMKTVIDQGCHFLGRAKMNRNFPVIKQLSDGTYLSKTYKSEYDRRYDRNGTIIRVIEYTIDDPQRTGHQEPHRLLTTLLDEKEHSAQTLIELYHERWEEEIGIDELKTHLRNAATLRSQKPSGVIQELYGLLIAHFLLRKLAVEATQLVDVPPNRISFTGTINVLRARLPEAPKSPRQFKDWYRMFLIEISFELVEPRRNRINPRVIKRTQSKWSKKHDKHRNLPPLNQQFVDSIVLLT